MNRVMTKYISMLRGINVSGQKNINLSATTRNWNTVNKLYEIVKENDDHRNQLKLGIFTVSRLLFLGTLAII